MASIIDLSNISTNNERVHRYLNNENETNINPLKETPTAFELIPLQENEEMLKNLYPEKLLFTIKEVSEILNTSYEFIRQQIIKGKIPAIGFGDRRMVNISTLVKILTYGV